MVLKKLILLLPLFILLFSSCLEDDNSTDKVFSFDRTAKIRINREYIKFSTEFGGFYPKTHTSDVGVGNLPQNCFRYTSNGSSSRIRACTNEEKQLAEDNNPVNTIFNFELTKVKARNRDNLSFLSRFPDGSLVSHDNDESPFFGVDEILIQNKNLKFGCLMGPQYGLCTNSEFEGEGLNGDYIFELKVPYNETDNLYPASLSYIINFTTDCLVNIPNEGGKRNSSISIQTQELTAEHIGDGVYELSPVDVFGSLINDAINDGISGLYAQGIYYPNSVTGDGFTGEINSLYETVHMETFPCTQDRPGVSH